MVYLELVKIFPPRKLAKPLGFSWVIEPYWGSKEGGKVVQSVLRSCYVWFGGLRNVCRWAGVGIEVQEGAAGQLCFFD
jgi:hypothetical protein